MNIFAGFTALDVLKQGKVVANPEAWKKGQVTAGFLAAFLTAAFGFVRAIGYEIPVTDDQIGVIAGWIYGGYGVYNVVATVVSSDKIGFKAKS